jgi:hypothetical protein
MVIKAMYPSIHFTFTETANILDIMTTNIDKHLPIADGAFLYKQHMSQSEESKSIPANSPIKNKTQWLVPMDTSGVDIKVLDWFKTDLETEFAILKTPTSTSTVPSAVYNDVIVVCDVVVFPPDVPHIIRMLEHFMPPGCATVTYFGIVSYREPYGAFMEKLTEKFDVEIMPAESFNEAYYLPRTHVLKITAK